jgi:hypothetical protein
MDEYISREDVFQKEKSSISVPTDNEWDCGYNTAMAEMKEFIKKLPAADVQPVVHCKDCKYREEHHYEEPGEKPYIKYECKFTKYSMSDNGFCSFGARMDGGEE